VTTERATNGEIPVEALLAQLRRAAERDGVEDVDAVVAEFATYVRAQAPRIAAQRAGRRSGLSWSGALLTAGALSVAAFGAVASGLVALPFLPSAASSADATARGADQDADDALGLTGLVGSDGTAADGQASNGTGTGDGSASTATATTDALTEPAPVGAFAETAPMTFTDPDALGSQAPSCTTSSTTPVTPSTNAADPADPADAACTPTTPTTPTAPTTAPATDATTTTLPMPVLDASIGPETSVSPTPADQQQDQQNSHRNDAFTDQGGAG
jgi:hypothetical protein